VAPAARHLSVALGVAGLLEPDRSPIRGRLAGPKSDNGCQPPI